VGIVLPGILREVGHTLCAVRTADDASDSSGVIGSGVFCMIDLNCKKESIDASASRQIFDITLTASSG
jgi:hypothetical protein